MYKAYITELKNVRSLMKMGLWLNILLILYAIDVNKWA